MALPISEVPEPEDSSRLSDDEAHAIIRSLIQELDGESDEMREYRDYFDGDQTLKYSTTEFKRAYGELFDDFRANWCEVAIEATEERLELDRIVYRDEEEGEVNEEVTKAIHDVLVDNDLSLKENDLYSSSMIEKRSGLMIWPKDEGGASVRVIRGTTFKVVYEDDDLMRPQYAVRRWRNQLGVTNITLYTPEWIYKYKVPEQFVEYLEDPAAQESYESSGWERRPTSETGDPSWPLPNPFSRIPIVEFSARKNRSELKVITPIQDMINKTLVNMAVAAEFAAVKQAYIITSNEEPDGGWKRRPGEIWAIQPEVDLDGKALPTEVGTIDAMDPQIFIDQIKTYLDQFSNMTSTPAYYVMAVNAGGGRGDAPSGDSLRTSETKLMKKVEKYQQNWSPAWRRAGMLIHEALVVSGELSGELPDHAKVDWVNPQRHFMGMLLEEGRKMIAELHLPPWFAWRHIGLTEAEIKDAREEMERRQEEEQQRMEQQQQQRAGMDNPGNGSTGVGRNTGSQMNSGSQPSNT